MGLFKPIWMTEKLSKTEKAVAAVREIKDQDKLYEIAVNAPQLEVIFAAIRCLEDDHLLAEYARTMAGCYNTRDLALSCIKNQGLLTHLALTGGDWLADCAAKYVKDPELLLEIAMSDSFAAADCASRIKDPEAKRKAQKEIERKKRETARILNIPARMTDRLKKVSENKLHDLITEAYAERRSPSQREPWMDIQKEIERRIRRLPSNGNVALLEELIQDRGLEFKTALTCIEALFSEALDNTDGIDELRGRVLEDFIANRLSNGDVSSEFVRLACTLPPDAQKKYGFEVYTTESGCDEPDGHVTWERTHVRWRDRYYYYP